MPTAVANELVETLDEIRRRAPRVLVAGDSCRDEYIFCRRKGDRLECIERKRWLGMGGAVARTARKLGATDSRSLCLNNAVTHQRIFVDGHLERWIEFPTYRGLNVPYFVLGELKERNRKPDVLLISDYQWGAWNEACLRNVIDAANAAGVPVLVDPHRQTDWTRYAGASVIKASLETWDNYTEGIHTLQRFGHVVITLGGRGMMYAEGKFRGWADERVEPIAAPYPCGAGDTVLAAIGCAVAAGIDLARACRLANAVAGIKCRTLGPLTLSPGELRAALA